jgi:hypothetical protein
MRTNREKFTDIKVSGTAGPEGPLDVSGTVRGQVVITLSASFRRHGGDGSESGCGGVNGQGAELSVMLYTRRDPYMCRAVRKERAPRLNSCE